MFKGLGIGIGIFVVPAAVAIGAGLAVERYFNNNKIAECENYSVSGNLAIKNLQKEYSDECDDCDQINEEIENLEQAQTHLTGWENSNVVNKVVKRPPVRNKEWYKKTPNIQQLEDEISKQLDQLQKHIDSKTDDESDSESELKNDEIPTLGNEQV